MEKGWQMGQVWVDQPNQLQKCQIAAERLFTSIHNGRKETAIMMAAYIIYHLPKTKSIDESEMPIRPENIQKTILYKIFMVLF